MLQRLDRLPAGESEARSRLVVTEVGLVMTNSSATSPMKVLSPRPACSTSRNVSAGFIRAFHGVGSFDDVGEISAMPLTMGSAEARGKARWSRMWLSVFPRTGCVLEIANEGESLEGADRPVHRELG